MLFRFFSLLIIWILTSFDALANEVQYVAVLDFRGVGIQKPQLEALTDEARIVGRNILPSKYEILTREKYSRPSKSQWYRSFSV